MKIRVIILSFFVAIIFGLFIQQSAQGEVVPYNYAGKKLTITFWVILIRPEMVLMGMNMVLMSVIATVITGRKCIKDG